MRTLADRVDFALHLVSDPRLDHVRREDVAAEEKLVVVVERAERFF